MPELYKLQNDGVPGKLDGGTPIIIGSALRVPERAYPAWGIEGQQELLHPLSLAGYVDEFVDTTSNWVPYVSEAAKRAGLGDRPQMLREHAANVATALSKKFPDRVKVTDLCSGPGTSAKVYINALKSGGFDMDRLNITLVDMSRGNVTSAVDNLEKEGLKYGKHFSVKLARDVDLPAHLPENSQDMVISVAGIHANAYLQPSIEAIKHVLRPGGALITADWHTYRWTCPCFTYRFLDETNPEEFGWKNKGALMDEFTAKFPASTHDPTTHNLHPHNQKGVGELGNFWRGWLEARRDAIRAGKMHPNDELIMLEAHRPSEWYVEQESRSGFTVLANPYNLVSEGIMPANPWQILPDSSLHALIVAIK